MRFSLQHSLVAVLLLVNFFIVASLGLALPTLSVLPEGCNLVGGNILCTDESAFSATLDTEVSPNISTLFERDDGKYTCDSDAIRAPVTKTSIKDGMAGVFCKRIDNMELNSQSVAMDARDPDTKTSYRMVVGTNEIIYAIEEALCTARFMRIIKECSGISTTLGKSVTCPAHFEQKANYSAKGGKWSTGHLTYEIHVLKVGDGK